MHNSFKLSRSRSLIASSVLAALMVSACNDSNASSETPAKNAATTQPQSKVAELITNASDINDRNHVCFTMDVNNVKCVVGDIVAYVPQPIIEEEDKANDKKDDKKKSKDDKKDEATAEQKAAQEQLLANQKALNEARSLVFVAKYCDMEKSVVYSKEGVACTFKPHSLYDAGAGAELEQYNLNKLNADKFFAEVAQIQGVEKFTDPAFGPYGGYRLFLKHGDATKGGLKTGDDTSAVIRTKRIDASGNVLGFYQEELNFANINPQMKILTKGLIAGDHVKLVFDTTLQNEQPLWRTSSLDFGSPYVWEVEVLNVAPAKVAPAAPAQGSAQGAGATQAPAQAPAEAK